MADLRTNFKDDILSTAEQGTRKFNIVDANGNVLYEGVHLEDVSNYLQVGDEYGADEINEQNEAINNHTNIIGDTDISDIGDGTVTGGISQLNSDKQDKTDNSLNTTSKNVVGAINELNSNLNIIGTMYSTNTLKATSIQASTETEFIKYTSGLNYGTYLVSLRVELTTVQPTSGALLTLKIGDKRFVTEIPPIPFIGNGTVTGVYKLDKPSDGISGSYYSINAVTIGSADLTIVKLK